MFQEISATNSRATKISCWPSRSDPAFPFTNAVLPLTFPSAAQAVKQRTKLMFQWINMLTHSLHVCISVRKSVCNSESSLKFPWCISATAYCMQPKAQNCLELERKGWGLFREYSTLTLIYPWKPLLIASICPNARSLGADPGSLCITQLLWCDMAMPTRGLCLRGYPCLWHELWAQTFLKRGFGMRC